MQFLISYIILLIYYITCTVGWNQFESRNSEKCNYSVDIKIADCSHMSLYDTRLLQIPYYNTETLLLSYNSISQLHGNEFRDAFFVNIKNLNISHNKLFKVDELAFNGLNFLTELDLSHNDLMYLPANIVYTNIQLYTLILTNNRLHNLSLRIPDSLTFLFVKRCKLREIPQLFTVENRSHSNLLELDAEDNEIINATLSDITRFPQLKLIKLHGNPIKTCTANDTKTVQTLIEINSVLLISKCNRSTTSFQELEKFQSEEEYKFGRMEIHLKNICFLLFTVLVILTLILVLIATCLTTLVVQNWRKNRVKLRSRVNTPEVTQIEQMEHTRNADPDVPPPYYSLTQSLY